MQIIKLMNRELLRFFTGDNSSANRYKGGSRKIKSTSKTVVRMKENNVGL